MIMKYCRGISIGLSSQLREWIGGVFLTFPHSRQLCNCSFVVILHPMVKRIFAADLGCRLVVMMYCRCFSVG